MGDDELRTIQIGGDGVGEAEVCWTGHVVPPEDCNFALDENAVSIKHFGSLIISLNNQQ